jgi:UrcA family protein
MFKTNAIIAAALCTAGLFSAPAFAETQTKTTEVHFKDLDLASPEGQQQLQGRIEKAARSVCRTERATTGTHLHSIVDRDCYKQALANVRERVATVIDKADDARLGG